MLYTALYQSPIGVLQIKADASFITHILFVKGKQPGEPEKHMPDVIKQCKAELDAYFAGTLKVFTVPYKLDGTDFQVRVWQELEKIPYGTTISYTQQAQRLGDLKAIRAVGTCNGKNKLAIIIPCHRVLGANGSLTGYAGGIENKKWLIMHEYAHSEGAVRNSLF